MLEIELDIFSGMPNPTWILSEHQEGELYELLNAEPNQISSETKISNRLGLGYRGLIVRRIKTDDGKWEKANSTRSVPFPDDFRLGIKKIKGESAADLLIKTADRKGVPIIAELHDVISKGVILIPRSRGPADPSAPIDTKRIKKADVDVDTPIKPGTKLHETWWACTSNCFYPNAHCFNDSYHVTRNNCYCFASNHRANIRYARPGRRGGHPCTSMTCGNVIDGLRADGWKDGCQPNNLTIVLVIWPNMDYHFYRLVTGRPFWWWGHKPGGTPARYTDDCGHFIFQYNGRGYAPNNICRGYYTNFCGYFYQNNCTAFVA
jgi:hypothetical protein